MKNNKIIKIITFSLIIFLILNGFLIIKNFTKQNLEEKLINISSLSEEFMNEYYNGVKKLQENDNKENILIVTSLNEISDNYGATDVVKAPNNQYFLQYETEEEKNYAFNKLNENKKIISVEKNNVYTTYEKSYNSWGINKMGINNAITVSGSNKLPEIVVAIIDTGCDITTLESVYPGKIKETYNVRTLNSTVTDSQGHGTHVAGTIAEGTPENVKVLPIKASYQNTNLFYDDDLINAVNYVVDNKKAHVINMSLGGPNSNNSVRLALQAAKQQNIIVVAAAGNDSSAELNYPASYDNTYSVSAVDQNLELAEFSNYGSKITFTAPGVDILSINGTASGTSMATPHVSAAVAILKSFDIESSFEEVMSELQKNAIDIGENGWDSKYGYGFVYFDADSLCNLNEGCIFKENSEGSSLNKIEVDSPTLTKYNYGTITNILATKVKLYYDEQLYSEKHLWQLEDIEIIGYNPLNNNSQTVTITYQGKKTSFEVIHPEGYQSGWEYEIIDDNSIKITKYKYVAKNETVSAGFLYIPSNIDNYNVISLGDSNDTESTGVFNFVDIYNKVVIPSTVLEIGNYAFEGFVSRDLYKIISESEVLKVGDYSFYGIDSLKEFIGNVSSVGKSAFENCINLKEISLKNTVAIGENAFRNSGLISINIPEGVEIINIRTFFECENLEEVILPESLKTIGDLAFYKTNIKNLIIPKNISSISERAFMDVESLENIIVDKDNNYYDSRQNSKALIEIETNKLLLASESTIIPDSIKIIGDYAFESYKGKTLVIPEGVLEINDDAFPGCIETLYIPKSVKTIGSSIASKNTMLVVHRNSTAQTYAQENNYNYQTIEPNNKSKVVLTKTEYYSFETLDTTGMYVELVYDEGRTEVIYDDIIVSYSNNSDSFRYGHKYAIITVTNSYGYEMKLMGNVNVLKSTPEYEIPKNLTAVQGQKLSDIALPDGFEWMDGEQIIEYTGNRTYKVKYIPEDSTNYEIIENISVTINVSKAKVVINPIISLPDKTYDGTNTIKLNSIKISNLNTSDYTVINANVSDENVGVRDAIIKIKLTDSKFVNSTFEDGLQEKEFSIQVNIVPQKLTKPTLVNKTYIYNGLEQIVELNNYNQDIMNISGNKRINAGEQDVIITLKNNNYIWEDNSNDDVVLKFKINKADSSIKYLSSGQTVKYDGNAYGINLKVESPNNVIIKYMDSDGNYVLDEMPKYIEIGTYTIKFKLFVGDNYTEIFDEEILKITSVEIINNTTDYEVIYDGNEHTISLNIDLDEYEIKYSVNSFDYNLNELPKFKDVGEYIINYKITSEGYEELIGSNKVKIYGITGFNESIKVKNNMLLLTNNSFNKLKNNIKIYSMSNLFNHLDNNKKTITDDSIKTGEYLSVKINNIKAYEYQLAHLGDVNGDGKINYLDYVDVYNHIQKIKNPSLTKKELKNIYLTSADMSGDNKVNYLDYVQIYNKIKELKGGK